MFKPVEFFFVEKRRMIAVDIGENPCDNGFAHNFSAVFDLVPLTITVEGFGFVVVEHDSQLVCASQTWVLFLHFQAFSTKVTATAVPSIGAQPF